MTVPTIPKAPYSAIVYVWALKRLPYHYFGVYVYTIRVHGALGYGGHVHKGSRIIT